MEDYIFGYFNVTKEAKEFHREFLLKRIELRPRLNPIQKDVCLVFLNVLFEYKLQDLTGPAAAIALDILSASTTTGNSDGNHTNSAISGKKKKKIKAQQKIVIDPASLGFRPSGDPNRINVGEIDNAPPVPVRRR